MEMPADELTAVLSNDGRFAESASRDHAYALWLSQRRPRASWTPQWEEAGRWIEASAAGCCAEAMAVLTRPDALYKVNAGYMGPEWSMYYGDRYGDLVPMRPQDAGTFPMVRSEASRVRRAVEEKFFDQWHAAGANSGTKFWSIPFLEPMEAA